MARTKQTATRRQLKAIREIRYQQKQTKPAIPKIAVARYVLIISNLCVIISNL